jgi:hypothetical protein
VRLSLEIAFLDSRRVLVSPEQFIFDLRDWRMLDMLALVDPINLCNWLVVDFCTLQSLPQNQTDLVSSINSILRVPPNKPPPARLSTIESNVDTTEYAWVNDLAPTTLTSLWSF